MGVAVRSLVAVVLAATSTAAQTAPAEAPKAVANPVANNAGPISVRGPAYTLRRCLDLAEKNYPKILEAKARVARARAKHSETASAPYSEFETTAGLTFAPGLSGTGVYSPNSDVSINDDLQLAWQAGLQGVIPLWTFGKIDNINEATQALVEVSQHDVRRAKNEVRLSVRRAYYGIQLANDAIGLVRTAMKRIDKYVVRLEKAVENEEGDPIELLKLRMYRAELDARHSEAVKQRDIARASLTFLIGAKTTVSIPAGPLEQLPHRLSPLSRYLAAAKLFRPEVNMARAGVTAREAQLRYEQARYYPDLGLGLSVAWSRAPGIDDQVNPFLRDPANYTRYGAGLVLRWKLDFFPQAARVDQAQAQLEEMRAQQSFALGGVGLEVEKAFLEAREAYLRLDAYTRAADYAKRWLISVQQSIEVGTMDNEEIVDPAKEWALKRFAKMTATYDFNMALARLALATGWDEVAPVD